MIDCAWRTRVTKFYQGEEAAAIIARATCQAPEPSKASDYEARPFDFADLNGAPEPEKWGPKYSKPVKRSRFNDETNIPTNCASGQKRDFSAAKHRAKLRAAFAATAEADKRAWALGKSKNDRGETIAQAYDRAMAEKRARLADPEAYARKLAAAEAARAKAIAKAAKAYRPRKAAKLKRAA